MADLPKKNRNESWQQTKRRDGGEPPSLKPQPRAVIGQGSCAQVFRATSRATGEERAIKVVDRRLVGEKAWRVAVQEAGPLPPGTRRGTGAAKVLRQLQHRHIVELVECVERHGMLYLVMELLAGGVPGP